jgi:hypothetical protein
MSDTVEEIQKDVAAIGQIDAVPMLLQVLCNSTGMGFAAIARVTDKTWTACAVKDDIAFGLKPGGQLDVETTLCLESRAARRPIAIDQASTDPVFCNHHTPRIYKIESYVSVPIVLANGDYFGNLCAIDPRPAQVSDTKTLSMFESFARLISLLLDQERSRASDQMALRDARIASELREQFIAVLGHDLRSPLQAIMAGGEVIERRSSDAMLTAVGGRIKSSARRMAVLIDNVLDFARARLGGGLGIEVKAVADLERALAAVVEEVRSSHAGREILSNIVITRTVACDIGRIQQVVSNLVKNALTYGLPDSRVEISAYDDDAILSVEVWNAGKPIPSENIDKIFQPFWRESTTRDREGLGLGLYICSQIVRAHGGTLTVKSTQADGTRFTVRLPVSSPAR